MREQGIILSRNTWYTVYLGSKKYNIDKSPPPLLLTRKRQPTVRCSRHSFSANALPRARVYSVQPHFGWEQVPCSHTPSPSLAPLSGPPFRAVQVQGWSFWRAWTWAQRRNKLFCRQQRPGFGSKYPYRGCAGKNACFLGRRTLFTPSTPTPHSTLLPSWQI